MHLHTRNVNTAFHELVSLFRRGYDTVHMPGRELRRTGSRNGAVLMVDEPVTVTYTHPRERVLFNPVRDANPFFHVVESLWMLAGRNDVTLPAYYVKRMAEFSDDGKTLNGAYGYRWRKARVPCDWDDSTGPFEFVDVDQLDVIVDHLTAYPDSRRAVLSMWNVEDDLRKVGEREVPGKVVCPQCRGKWDGDRMSCMTCDEGWVMGKVKQPVSKDVACNLNAMFSLREEKFTTTGGFAPGGVQAGTHVRRYLDMTVTNRSNDMLWGMLGANYVHFTFLQEYLAARLGAEVGVYHHISNNLHVYVDRPDWKPEALLAASDQGTARLTRGEVYPGGLVPLVTQDHAKGWDVDNRIFLSTHCGDERKTLGWLWQPGSFLADVARPMMEAYDAYKAGAVQDGYELAQSIKADDWRIACCEWLKRRMK